MYANANTALEEDGDLRKLILRNEFETFPEIINSPNITKTFTRCSKDKLCDAEATSELVLMRELVESIQNIIIPSENDTLNTPNNCLMNTPNNDSLNDTVASSDNNGIINMKNVSTIMGIETLSPVQNTYIVELQHRIHTLEVACLDKDEELNRLRNQNHLLERNQNDILKKLKNADYALQIHTDMSAGCQNKINVLESELLKVKQESIIRENQKKRTKMELKKIIKKVNDYEETFERLTAYFDELNNQLKIISVNINPFHTEKIAMKCKIPKVATKNIFYDKENIMMCNGNDYNGNDLHDNINSHSNIIVSVENYEERNADVCLSQLSPITTTTPKKTSEYSLSQCSLTRLNNIMQHVSDSIAMLKTISLNYNSKRYTDNNMNEENNKFIQVSLLSYNEIKLLNITSTF